MFHHELEAPAVDSTARQAGCMLNDLGRNWVKVGLERPAKSPGEVILVELDGDMTVLIVVQKNYQKLTIRPISSPNFQCNYGPVS